MDSKKSQKQVETTLTQLREYLLELDTTEKVQKLFQQVYGWLFKEIESDLTVGRVLIRPSGTENLIRVMVESESKETAQKYASDISKLFE